MRWGAGRRKAPKFLFHVNKKFWIKDKNYILNIPLKYQNKRNTQITKIK